MNWNRKTLYRSLSGAALVLFAAFAFAPELGFTPPHLLLLAKDGTPKTKTAAHEPAPQSQPKVPAAGTHDTHSAEPINEQPADDEESAFAQNEQPARSPAASANGNQGAAETNNPVWMSVAPGHHFSGGSALPKNADLIASAGSSAPTKIIGTTNPPSGPTGDNKDQPTGEPQHSDHTTDNDDGYATNPETPRVVTVPEPSSLLLLAAGIIGLIIARRRIA